MGHDMKLASVWGRYRGVATAGQGIASGPAGLPVDTNCVEPQFLLLNTWRIMHCVAYATYCLPAAVPAWTATRASTSYTNAGSHFRQGTASEIDLVIGYSSLEDATKYENHYNNVFLDLSGASVSTSCVSTSPSPPSSGDTSKNTAMDLRTTEQLGWLFFHRWLSANGFGFYLRLAYAFELDVFGGSSKPSERKAEDSDRDSIIARPSNTSHRHGPWFDLGVVL